MDTFDANESGVPLPSTCSSPSPTASNQQNEGQKSKGKVFFITNQMLNWWFIEKDRQGNWQSEKSNQVDKTDKIER